MRFKKGDTGYLIESQRRIRKIEIIGASGGFYTVKFCDSGSSAIRIREGRLYGTEDEAFRALNANGYREDKKEEIHQVPLH